MKVVILAGGRGTRLAEETEVRPKPMVEIGGRPLLWHIMKHFAHYGFKEFYKVQIIDRPRLGMIAIADIDTGDGHNILYPQSPCGEDIGLFDTDGSALIDSISDFPAQSADTSYGRDPDGANNWDFFESPTPGNSNE